MRESTKLKWCFEFSPPTSLFSWMRTPQRSLLWLMLYHCHESRSIIQLNSIISFTAAHKDTVECAVDEDDTRPLNFQTIKLKGELDTGMWLVLWTLCPEALQCSSLYVHVSSFHSAEPRIIMITEIWYLGPKPLKFHDSYPNWITKIINQLN